MPEPATITGVATAVRDFSKFSPSLGISDKWREQTSSTFFPRAIACQTAMQPTPQFMFGVDRFSTANAVGVQSMDRQLLVNNVAALAKTAKVFSMPVILTTVAATTFSGPTLPEIAKLFPDQDPIDRSSLNAWADARVVNAIKKTTRQKLIMAGLWTEFCLTLPVLSALDAGFDVYFVADASGGSSRDAHDLAIQRMIQAGATPIGWATVLSEQQYDWARRETYSGVIDIVREHAGAWGAGVDYLKAMGNPTAQQAA
jgi:nicotinamidase-related amidase